jgi:GH15 family glucan-1,4-alpha-glucosidase
VAARRSHLDAVAHELARRTVAGAFASGLAEYWNPDTGEGLGAVPQSWAGLALVMARREGIDPDA